MSVTEASTPPAATPPAAAPPTSYLQRFAAPAAATAAVTSAVLVVAAVWLHLRWVRPAGLLDAPLQLGEVVTGLIYPAMGAVLVARRHRSVVGWLLVSASMLGVFAFAGRYAVVGLLVVPGALPGAEAAAWLNVWTWAPWMALMSLVPLYFPDDKLPSPRWRPVAVTAAAAVVVVTLVRTVAPVELDAASQLVNPFGIASLSWLKVVTDVGVVVGFGICAPLAIASLLLRTRGADGDLRAQVQLLVVAEAVHLVTLLTQRAVPSPWDDVLWTLGLATIPLAIVVAITRHRLYDIELVLRCSAVHATLTLALVIASFAAVWIVGRLAPDGNAEVPVVAGVALLAAAGRNRAQRLLAARIYGPSRDPFQVVQRLSERVELAADPVDALHQVLAEAVDALRPEGLALVPEPPLPLAPITVGAPVGGERLARFPVLADGRPVAEILLQPRRGTNLTVEEGRLLTELARRAAGLVQAASLLAELRASRARTVSGREEERRRVRHDLHDGVGPALAGLALQLESLQRRLADDPELDLRVGRMRDDLRATVDEVRRVVDDLRPAALDLGLVAAIRARVEAFDDQVGTRVDLDVLGPLPPVGAATEVAVYRIATEALANAVRHANARRITVVLRGTATATTVEVHDDGIGLPTSALAARPTTSETTGLGLTSVRERAEELGGHLHVEPLATGGTRVHATIPRGSTP